MTKRSRRSTISPQMRRHTADELQHLERYAEEHKKDIEAGDHHDPSAFEMFCDENPEADECKFTKINIWKADLYSILVFWRILHGGSGSCRRLSMEG